MKKNKSKVFTRKDYESKDGMLTAVWGPGLWHSLHAISFNYPNIPTKIQQKKYKSWVQNLKYVLPCKYCRINLIKNFKQLPLLDRHMKNRYTFSKYIYDLHELINKMLGKKSGLTYCDVKERYEHFRARCNKTIKMQNFIPKKENGCTEPLYGIKSKCVIQIVPHETKCKTFNVNQKCKTKRITQKFKKKRTGKN
uniref:thiol oxidase n=1 Tax=viral metagenome TaxID=1070528 RepID=A0A6C0L154_9ZZZZ